MSENIIRSPKDTGTF